jgi:hypothetical protein
MRLTLLAAVPNLLFGLLGNVWVLPHPIINVDYAWLVLLYPWLGLSAAAVAFGVIFVLDVLLSVATGFHGDARALLDAAPNLALLPRPLVLGIALAFVSAGALFVWVGRRILRDVPRRLGPNLVVFLAVIGVVAWIDLRYDVVDDPQQSRSVVLGGALPLILVPYLPTGPENHGIVNSQVASSTRPLFHELDDRAAMPPHIVVVVMESLGYNAVLDSAIMAPMLTPAMRARYVVTEGTVPFNGSTVKGEIRALCHAQAGSVHLDATLLPHRTCLPARLASRGYHTVGLHGYDGYFFERSTWWPAVGFQEEVFPASLPPGFPARRCGDMFRGLCDDDVRQEIAARLRAARTPLFLYWMTLNAHVNRVAPDAHVSQFPCASLPAHIPTADVCALVQLHAIVFKGMAETALDPAIGPTEFILVGDHAPPLARVSERKLFSDTVVPWIILVPRDTSGWVRALP